MSLNLDSPRSKTEVVGKSFLCGKCEWCSFSTILIILVEDNTVQKICKNCSEKYTSKEDRKWQMEN
jgi:hypothetical protein